MKSNLSWKVLVFVNLILGTLLWFLYSTDYSLVGTVSDFVFPISVAIVALLSLGVLKKTNKKIDKIIGILAPIPSLLGGCLPLLVGILMFVPPFTLGAMFFMDEALGERQIQVSLSPSKTEIARVYFRGVGAYASGSGRIYIRISNRYLPMLERDIYSSTTYTADESTTDYIKWLNDDTLLISETGQSLSIGKMETEVPAVISIPVFIFKSLVEISEEEARNRELTIPVSDFPVFPEGVVNDQSEYEENEQNIFRSFNIRDHNVDEVAEWYENALSNHPWKIIASHRDEGERIYHCFEVQREDRIYYLELMGGKTGSVHINIGTPFPITEVCEKYFSP